MSVKFGLELKPQEISVDQGHRKTPDCHLPLDYRKQLDLNLCELGRYHTSETEVRYDGRQSLKV